MPTLVVDKSRARKNGDSLGERKTCEIRYEKPMHIASMPTKRATAPHNILEPDSTTSEKFTSRPAINMRNINPESAKNSMDGPTTKGLSPNW